jgi:hypothetical protein
MLISSKKNQVQWMSSVGSVPANPFSSRSSPIDSLLDHSSSIIPSSSEDGLRLSVGFDVSEGEEAEELDVTELAELRIFTIMFLCKDICTFE